MAFVRSSGFVVGIATAGIVTTMGLFGCVTTGGNLTSSAQRLEHSADELREDARRGDVSSSYTRDAQELAEEARDFRHVVEDRRASDNDVRDAFEDLSKSYHALRDEVEHGRDRDVERDFQPVTEAYLDVEREMSGYHRDRDRYARE
jgi:hypothetical protein